MGQKASKSSLSRDQQKINSYYQPIITDQKFKNLQERARKLKFKYVYRSLIFGFVLQYCIGVSRLYDNVNRRSTMRRLDAKLKQDREIGQKLKQEANRNIKQQAKHQK